jgi:hypothetical protein
MKTKWHNIGVFILTLVLIVASFPILRREPIFMDSQEKTYPGVFISDYGGYKAYKFNPETILQSIQQGNTNFLTSINTVSFSGEPVYSNPFPFKQADYLAIANAMQQFHSSETVKGWSLHHMLLDGDCQYDPLSFDIVQIFYFKSTGLQKYSARMIAIYPLYGEGEMGTSGYFPRSVFSSWDYIDLNKLKINAEEALLLAEKNGGKQFRLANNNMCRISFSLGLYPNPSHPSWDISYKNKQDLLKEFEMTIEAYTGEYKVTQPK